MYIYKIRNKKEKNKKYKKGVAFLEITDII